MADTYSQFIISFDDTSLILGGLTDTLGSVTDFSVNIYYIFSGYSSVAVSDISCFSLLGTMTGWQ